MKNVAEFLEQSAKKIPQKIAYFEGEKSITYAELDARSDALASYLLETLKGGKHGILILLDKSINAVISIYASAKSGNFYSCIDAKNPPDRLTKICEILKPKFIIKKDDFNADFLGIPCINESEFNKFSVNTDLLQNAKENQIDMDLLYVLFTSGSTGVPKGVCTPHKNAIEYIRSVMKYCEFNSDDIFANHANFYFEKSTLEIYAAVLAGATTYFVPSEFVIFPVRLIEFYAKAKISVINFVPSIVNYVANSGIMETVDLPHLRRVLIGGEMLNAKLTKIWQNALPKAKFINFYGPTEITGNCAYYTIASNRNYWQIPIGKGRENYELLLFDDEMNLITSDEIDKKGEICVRGGSIALGYFGNESQSEKVFIQNPLNENYREFIYKTGDVGVYNEFGELVCLGRKDNQIKINSHRVELGEIETAINLLESVKICVCIFVQNKIICFYEGKETDFGILSQKLLSYMIPSKYIKMDKIPLNANGKMDRKKLKEDYEANL